MIDTSNLVFVVFRACLNTSDQYSRIMKYVLLEFGVPGKREAIIETGNLVFEVFIACLNTS